MADRLFPSSKLHVSLAVNVQQRLRRCYAEYHAQGRLWVEPGSIQRAMMRMRAMHKRYHSGDLRHTASELKSQEEVMRWVYHQHCALGKVEPKPEQECREDFAAMLATQRI